MSDDTLHPCRIIKTKPSGGGLDEHVLIEITDDASHIQVVEIRMTLDEFGKLMASPTYASCELRLRSPDKIGWVRENKTERVPIGDTLTFKEAEAREALAPFEVDGWRGSWRDLNNGHRRSHGTATVGFTRLVEPTQ